MTAARTLTAVDPATGARITRRTARPYVAAVVVTRNGAAALAPSSMCQQWASRADLAAAALAQALRSDPTARLAPVVTPEPTAAPVAATPEPATADPLAAAAAAPVAAAAPEPVAAPAAPVAAAAAELAAAVITPATPEAWAIARAQAQAARAAARVTLPGEPPAAPRVPPAPGGGVAAHRAAAAAGRPVSLAALARDMGRSLGLASGGRLPGPAPAPAPTGDPLEGLPWDPGTPEARARHAAQGRIAAALYPIARAATGAGCTLPPSWLSDGPALNGELAPMRALEALPLPTMAAAAAALAALPPVTEAQAQGLAYCRAALRAAAARL